MYTSMNKTVLFKLFGFIYLEGILNGFHGERLSKLIILIYPACVGEKVVKMMVLFYCHLNKAFQDSFNCVFPSRQIFQGYFVTSVANWQNSKPQFIFRTFSVEHNRARSFAYGLADDLTNLKAQICVILLIFAV